MHVGAVERRDGDVFGAPVNRAARIQGAAHGGQVLVSQALYDDVQDRLPADIALRNLGAVRLRDLGAAEPLYQLVHPALRDAFPALRSLEATPNNLPQQVTSFVGRERELGEAKKLLGQARLLTLLGMGGHGKTRLSLQIAADMLDLFSDGVWFLDLAPIQDPALVPGVAAQALNIQEEPGKPLLQTLCAHVKSHTGAVHHRQLRAPHGRVREPRERAAARGAGRAHHRHQPRGAAHPGRAGVSRPARSGCPTARADAQALLRSEAVLLFVERARLHKPAFAITERNAPAVAELVARLEGIPLALELAAARVRSLSIEDINVRLKDRFKLLTGGSRVALERQQTLRALVQWSYDLLQPDETALLDRLSMFSGGFDIAAAEAVGGVDPLDPYDVARPRRIAGREVARADRGNRRRHPLRHARDDPRILARAAAGGRRLRRDGRAPLRLLPRSSPRPPATACRAPNRRNGRAGSRPTSTTSAPPSRLPCPAASTPSSR